MKVYFHVTNAFWLWFILLMQTLLLPRQSHQSQSPVTDFKLLSRADSLLALSHCIHKFSSLRLQARCSAVEMAKQRIALVQFRSTSKKNGKTFTGMSFQLPRKSVKNSPLFRLIRVKTSDSLSRQRLICTQQVLPG